MVSLAIGKLLGEKKISLGDKICSFFPEFTDDNTDVLLSDTTIEDMLKMAVPARTDSYLTEKDVGWAESFFRIKGVKPAGILFDYNSSATFILGVLVEKITGKKFIEYLRPEFNLIGVGENISCVKTPDGYAWGSSGVCCTLRDFARINLLVMNGGSHEGKQLLPRDYIVAATSKQISNFTQNNYTPRNACGYGYQFWITDKGFSMYGMGSQYSFCFPDKDFLFVCNGDTQVDGYDFAGEFLYEWVSEIYDGITDGCLANSSACKRLSTKLQSFSLPDCTGKPYSPVAEKISGKLYECDDNELGIKRFSLNFSKESGEFVYEKGGDAKKIVFGLCDYKKGEYPENDVYGDMVFKSSPESHNVYSVGEWTDENTLLIRVYVVGTNFGNLFVSVGFKENRAGISMQKRAEFFLNGYQGFAEGKKV